MSHAFNRFCGLCGLWNDTLPDRRSCCDCCHHPTRIQKPAIMSIMWSNFMSGSGLYVEGVNISFSPAKHRFRGYEKFPSYSSQQQWRTRSSERSGERAGLHNEKTRGWGRAETAESIGVYEGSERRLGGGRPSSGDRTETERESMGPGAWSRAETVSGRAETLSTTVDSGSAAAGSNAAGGDQRAIAHIFWDFEDFHFFHFHFRKVRL